MIKISSNRINGAIKAKLLGLVAQLEESKTLDHSLSKGILREKYLTDFLSKVLPPNYTVSGGFICDSLGEISTQIDLIISDTSTLPQVLLGREVSLIPVESAIGTVEVKSILDESVFAQIQTQITSFKSLQPIVEGNGDGKFGIRHFIFAYESRVSKKRILEWLEQVDWLFGICILGDEYIFKGTGGIKSVKQNKYDEVLVFLSSLTHLTIKVENERALSTRNIWRRYLQGVDPLSITFDDPQK